MTKKELEILVKQLEARIVQLEARPYSPQYIPYPQPMRYDYPFWEIPRYTTTAGTDVGKQPSYSVAMCSVAM